LRQQGCASVWWGLGFRDAFAKEKMGHLKMIDFIQVKIEQHCSMWLRTEAYLLNDRFNVCLGGGLRLLSFRVLFQS
jgi:hypothetical protein